MIKHLARSALAISTLLLAACGGGGGSSTGTVSIAVQDAPVDGADAVYITFSRIDLHGPDGIESFVLDSDPATEGNQPYTVNLMDYQGTDRLQLLDGVTVPAGSYQWIRLYVDAAEIVFNEGLPNEIVEPLDIPSNENSGLKLISGFTVAAGGASDFTVEFDLRKSVHEDANGYKLRPTLRLVDNLQAGHFAGTVGSAAAGDDCAVYVYAGASVTPDDVCYVDNGGVLSDCADPHGVNPLTSAEVSCDTSTTPATCHYATAPLVAGDYTLALTCDAEADNPAADDNIAFLETHSATVNAGTGATPLHFTLP
ncbi:MAG: DUF4382 domain-containing protein [Pseudomonadota bacterium]